MKRFSQHIDEDAPANAAGNGGVAGIGIGPKGEPGVDLKKRKKEIEDMAKDAQLDEAEAKERYVIKKTPDGWRWYDSQDLSIGGEWRSTKRDAQLDLDDYLETHKDDIREDRETFAGAPVFDVDMDRIMKTKNPKHPRHRYARYVGTDEMGEAIRQHGRSTRGDIVIRDSKTAVMTYLRRKPVK
jgi:hypothetical protein